MKDNQCQNCDSKWSDDELKEIKDFHQRVDPGEECPSGECPECGALCHPIDADPTRELMKERATLLEALRYANELIPIARRYFPKSIKNSDRFRLENTCATIGRALHNAEAEGRKA